MSNVEKSNEDNAPQIDSSQHQMTESSVEQVNTQKLTALRPNDQRARYAILFIWIILGLEVVSILSSYMQYDLLQNTAGIDWLSHDVISQNDTRESVVAMIHMIFSLISAITFIQWFRRAYYNLHLRVDQLSQTEGWAAGCWFVPILNLFRPYQLMKEMYVETRRYLNDNGMVIKDMFNTNNLTLWWTLWIVSNLIGQGVFRYSLRADTVEELSISTVSEMVVSALGIPLALVTIKLIKDYAKLETLLNKVE